MGMAASLIYPAPKIRSRRTNVNLRFLFPGRPLNLRPWRSCESSLTVTACCMIYITLNSGFRETANISEVFRMFLRTKTPTPQKTPRISPRLRPPTLPLVKKLSVDHTIRDRDLARDNNHQCYPACSRMRMLVYAGRWVNPDTLSRGRAGERWGQFALTPATTKRRVAT